MLSTMHTFSRTLRAGALVLALGGLVACGGPKPLALTVVGTPNLNSVEDDVGNAANVHIYELSNDTNFRNATLETFWQDEAGALGSELIDSRQLLLYPDAMEQIEIEPAEETQYIGIAANLRQPDREQWRQVYSVEALRGNRVMVEVGKNRVIVDVREN